MLNGFRKVDRYVNRLVFTYQLRHYEQEKGRMIFAFDGDDFPTSEQVEYCRNLYQVFLGHLFVSGLEESLKNREDEMREKGITLISKDIFSYTTESGEEELKWVLPVSVVYNTIDHSYEGVSEC